MMVSILNSSYYSSTKWPLMAMGQWPFQSAMKNRFFKFLTIFAISSIWLPTVIKLMELLTDIKMVMECIPFFCFISTIFVKIFSWAMNSDNMKELLLCIERDWKSLKYDYDIKLLTEFSERGRIINNLYAVFCFGIILSFLAVPLIPILMDIWIPLNQSRPRIFLYHSEYFVDQNEYYFSTLIHAYLTIPFGCGAIVAFDNLFSIFIHHLCGMCNVVKLHLESVHRDDIPDYGKSAYERIKMCADMQTNILDFVQQLESICTIPFLIMTGLSMIIITLEGTMAVLNHDAGSEMYLPAAFAFGATCHLFWSSFLGHNLIVESEPIYLSVYQSEWHVLPAKLQRMLIPIMMRSADPCQITAGKVYVMSMASFGAAMRMNMSFFTLLLSMQ